MFVFFFVFFFLACASAWLAWCPACPATAAPACTPPSVVLCFRFRFRFTILQTPFVCGHVVSGAVVQWCSGAAERVTCRRFRAPVRARARRVSLYASLCVFACWQCMH